MGGEYESRIQYLSTYELFILIKGKFENKKRYVVYPFTTIRVKVGKIAYLVPTS